MLEFKCRVAFSALIFNIRIIIIIYSLTLSELVGSTVCLSRSMLRTRWFQGFQYIAALHRANH